MPNKLAPFGNIGLGAAVGAAAMYFLDPVRGARRRAMVSEKLIHYAHETGDELGKAQRDLWNRLHGLVAQVETLRQGHDGHAPDAVIEARVKTKLGRVVAHPGAIRVVARDGVVTLAGSILSREVEKAISAARSVSGVREIVNQLEPHQSAESIPALQGWSPPSDNRFEFFQTNWSPAARVFAALTGGGLVIFGLARRGVVGMLAAIAGTAFAIRGISNTPWKRLLGIGAGRGAISFQKEIDVSAPVGEVFAIWANFENFPLFMEHVLQVKTEGNNRSRWVVRGPAESQITWEAITTKIVLDRVIAWKTTPGAPVASAGIVKFQPTRLGGTRVDIRLSYTPPAGAAGNLLAAVLGSDPLQEINDDLMRFKSLIEDGKTTVRGQPVTLGQVVRRTETTLPGAQPTGTRPRAKRGLLPWVGGRGPRVRWGAPPPPLTPPLTPHGPQMAPNPELLPGQPPRGPVGPRP